LEQLTEVDITCIALAGGKSTRLGRNKLKEIVGSQTIYGRAISVLAQLKGEVMVVTAPDIELPLLNSAIKVRIEYDVYPGFGALGAIYTGLLYSKTPYNLVAACDMPFLNLELLRYMAAVAPGYDLIAFHKEDRPEPLHAVYSRNCLAPMKSLIERNERRIIGILPYIKIRYLTEAEIERFDPGHLSFFNINTEADLQKAHLIARGML
jgi:molybdenum cofactor guanylyltransferase